MARDLRFALMTLLAALIAAPAIGPVLAQQTPPAADGAATPSDTQQLKASQFQLTSGQRASKLIGASVYNDGNDKIGSVDDLILAPDDKAALVILQVGGFLGLGGKLVAVKFGSLRQQDGKIVLPGGDKNALNAEPSFTYGG